MYFKRGKYLLFWYLSAQCEPFSLWSSGMDGRRINPSSVCHRARLPAAIRLIAGDFVWPLWSCVNALKQSGGININVVITALRGHSPPGSWQTPCEQREERKSSLHLLPHTCRMADVPQQVTSAPEALLHSCHSATHHT